MATASRQSPDTLVEQLLARPKRYAFFQAIHLLEQHFASKDDVVDIDAKNEFLQIRPNTSLACPASDIESIELLPPADVDDERDRYRLTVNFLGLYGVDSPLPDYYMEDFVQGEDQESPKRRFLDVFHHRLYWLLYFVWKKYRYYVQFRPDGKDVFSQRVFSFVGLTQESDRNDLGFSAHRLLPFMGELTRAECPATVLQHMISRIVGVPATVQSFVKRTVIISPEQRTKIGVQGSQLGVSTVMGESISDRSGKFRIVLEQLTRGQFASLLTGGKKRLSLEQVIRKALNQPLVYELQLRLKKGEHMGLVLGDDQAKLGMQSWLLSSQNTLVGASFEESIK